MTEPVPTTQPTKAGEEKTLSTAALAAAGARPQDRPAETPTFEAREDAAPLLGGDEATGLRAQWDAIQAGFVDEPRRSVEEADTLVASAMKRLAEVFAAERGKLEGQWDRGDDVSTEDLRVALRRYRAFFGRLLAI